MARLTSIVLIVFAFVLGAIPLRADAAHLRTRSEAQWLEDIQRQAIASGISPFIVHEALDNFTPNYRVIELDRRQPESTITFQTYRRNVITPARIRKGAALLKENRALLSTIEARTGVPPQIVVAIWGIESSFGQNTGNFNVINSLATLAYEGRRATFFQSELFAALRILERERMTSDELLGSWAGAMGQCQFMPSTYLRYAADGDNDGDRDIWNSVPDVLSSIATYLAAEGWKQDLTWGREVRARAIPQSQVGLGVKKSLRQWAKMGVTNPNGSPLPTRDIQASLIQPGGINGPSYLVYDNFRALMRWNKSTYFATSVGILANAIKAH